ncbi:molybdate transport system substrate-binding protein [Archangium gephyra]|uniref:Molybdate transport system substrate-binding protein n=1 Tax=Archangium gephyra TaxID=48 RepID=A0AAC8QD34_9BACT|nr:molybdate ABC transporter substrate-binding protein [Archangium gephyra]AKJ04866.1 Molybdenum ABC transporter, periplasmic molybdenum-binding protein ModA [Archangium gephyra]REG37092.1 molybdate transport system substrate-binding protein [Archangium gephyra]
MNVIVKGALAAGALLIIAAGLKTGLREHGAIANSAPSAGAEEKRTLSIAAASDLKFALDELLVPFRAKHPGADVQVTYGSSGNFLAQLSHGAPFDVFLSADVASPRRLAEQGLVAGEVFPYAVGRLAVWVPKDSPLPLAQRGLDALREPAARRIAIANPQHAPYGRAAEAALKSQGVYEAVKDRLVLGENIAQTAQFVQSGAAEAGILALALALAPAMREQGRFWEVPLDAYPRLEQGGAILERAKDAALAREFRDHLLGPEGSEVLERYGFSLPQQ